MFKKKKVKIDPPVQQGAETHQIIAEEEWKTPAVPGLSSRGRC